MDGTEIRRSTKVSVSQIIFRFRAFGSCIIANQPPRMTITTNLFYPRFQIIPSGHIDLFTSSSLYSSYTDFYLPQTVSK